MVRLSVEENRVGEAEPAFKFDFAETVEVELSHEAFELAVAEVMRGDFCLHELWVQNLDVFFGGVPADDVLESAILTIIGCTCSKFDNF